MLLLLLHPLLLLLLPAALLSSLRQLILQFASQVNLGRPWLYRFLPQRRNQMWPETAPAKRPMEE